MQQMYENIPNLKNFPILVAIIPPNSSKNKRNLKILKQSFMIVIRYLKEFPYLCDQKNKKCHKL